MRKRKETTLGFTLTELLIVIVIIGVLAALSTVAVMAARTAIINSLVRSQMSQMEIALEKYKADFGEYPPSLADEAATVRHARMRWKRANLSYVDIMNYAFAQPTDDLRDTVPDRSPFRVSGTDPDDSYLKSRAKIADFLDRSEKYHYYESVQLRSLTFWLSGMYDPIAKKFVGFSVDPADPLQSPYDPITGTLSNKQREQPRYEFSPEKANFALYEFSDPHYTYTDANGKTKQEYPFQVPYFAVRELPVAYFRANTAGGSLAYTTKIAVGSLPSPTTYDYGLDMCDLTRVNPHYNFGIAVPYARSGEPIDTNWRVTTTWEGTSPTFADKVVWYNEDKFQLIYPGLDRYFGEPKTGEPNYREKFPKTTTAVDAAVKSWFTTTGPLPSPSAGIVTSQGIAVEDLDNVTNFSKGATLNSEVK